MAKKAKAARQGSTAHVPTVAIGCSAGGIRALQSFFEEIPAGLGMAYVVVTHLDPDRPSELAPILQRHAQIPVEEVKDKAEFVPDRVLVIPPGRQIEVADNHIMVRNFDEPRGHRAPIDRFFRSLAEHHGDGFAVILSGSGSDGAVGLKAVKEHGGLILVQEPTEAEFGSMPRNAISTGLADAILPVRGLAARLVELAHDKQKLLVAGQANAENAVNAILGYLRARTGHDFSRYKRSTVMRRLTRRMQLTRAAELTDYLVFLRENVEEVSALFSDLLISVTTFFRDHEAYDALTTLVMPILVAESIEEPIRIWVPGCATGEEAYSVAIILLEECSRREMRPEIQIFATDLDPGVLATAREGRYPTAIEADVSEERLQRFFTRDGDHYRIKKDVRDLVVFASHSLLKDPPFSKLDLVSCRNLLIYLERDLQNQVCTSFHYALKPGRFLFLGSAETADGVPGQFRPVDRERRIYQAVEGFTTTLAPRLLLTPQAPVLPASRQQTRESSLVEASVHLSALEDMAPPSAIVDDDHRIVHLSESAGRFLQPSGGQVSTAITQLARNELRLDIRTGLHRAFEKSESSLSLPIPVRFNGGSHRVLVHVSPMHRRENSRPLALVMFIDAGPVESEAEHPVLASGNEEMIRQLQQELQLTRERLKVSRQEYEATTEELRAANEELQSINEEYRSTAEELETSKEELQSMNEELQTLNTELKLKLEGVSRAHSDLQNLMAATEVGTLFLDTALRIKRFTPRVAELFNITVGDEGRPITDFTHRLSYDDLEHDARTVLRDLVPQEREAESKAGRWYQMRLRPYRTVDDKIDGVVVTFVDVTERRRTEQRLLQLTAELDHRVKNILARVGVMIDRSRERAQTADDLAITLKRRIQSMADTHSLLSRTQWQGANLRQICNAELGLYAQGDNVSIAAPDIMLNARAAQSYSMVLHELTTNAVKHGALSRTGGKVALEFTVLQDQGAQQLRMRWVESGGPASSASPVRSYGLQTIEDLLPFELGAIAKVEFRPAGLFAEFVTRSSEVEAPVSA